MTPPQLDFAQWAAVANSLAAKISKLVEQIASYEQYLPAVAWLTNPLWIEAQWSATTYRWYPNSDVPPIMGLVFDRADAAHRLFQSWIEKHGHADELDELRVTIIEGDIPGERPGYAVHISADPENSLIRATAEGIVLDELPLSLFGQLRCMYPIPGVEPLLPQFKAGYARHHEFLLAPVTRRDDGNQYVDVECGIVKTTVHFQSVEEFDAQFRQVAESFAGETQ